ncbi:hypothetical protein V2J09_011025 [Rumex salicifolius]
MQYGHTKGNLPTLNSIVNASEISKMESVKSTIMVSASDGGDGFTLIKEPNEVTPIILKTNTSNYDEGEEKTRLSVIQQKGRFKITSENVDIEKVSSIPILHKSHSMQVISQDPITSQFSSPTDTPPTKTLNSSMFAMLHSFLQNNLTERENILKMMKNICSIEMSVERLSPTADSICPPLEIVALKKSMLEGVHDREKELLHEITDLQSRFICAKEELHKLNAENVEVNH